MKLKEYLELINKSPYKWATEHKLSVSTIWRAWKGDKVTPTLGTVKAIQEASKGAVKADDWY